MYINYLYRIKVTRIICNFTFKIMSSRLQDTLGDKKLKKQGKKQNKNIHALKQSFLLI